MFKKGMDSRGQISAEYLLLLVVTLVILSSVTIPLVGKSVDASNDVSDVSGANEAVNSIANAVNLVYANGPGARRTLQVYIPVNNLKIYTNDNGINTTVTLSDGTNKSEIIKTDYPMATKNYTLSQGTHTISIYWAKDGPHYISYTIT